MGIEKQTRSVNEVKTVYEYLWVCDKCGKESLTSSSDYHIGYTEDDESLFCGRCVYVRDQARANIWVTDLNIETGEIERRADYVRETLLDCLSDAEFNGEMSVGVYAESLVSQADADRMVREKCKELAECFTRAYTLLNQEGEPLC
jgi:hypothetical protein